MSNKNSFSSSIKRALLGNTNGAIRAIGLREEGNKLIVKCFVNRSPIEEDFESLNDISGEIIADYFYDRLEESCEYSVKSIAELSEINDMVIVDVFDL